MDDQHHPTSHPYGSDAPPGGGQALWDSTVAALAAAGIDVAQAGDGRPGAVLEPGPRGLAVAVRWQPTEQHPHPGGALSVTACRGGPVSARQIHNMILESHLTDAGLRTAYADGHLVVVQHDLEIPGRPRPVRAAAPAAAGHPAPAVPERRPRRWPTNWLRRGTGR
ncbi:hypothetical protein [Streptomyces sp. CB03911]|uniref:hypothetical protein n=1 Tax=Streptomyces sp. CB03911 TaxID=1804758 RepID=UPI00093CE1D1|nr:hypothetical protein [Streptomyces sp. CB03911]OKI25163.1 hypothetical protein A6A07_31745 [Streptomyces sp. CB03911]